MFGGLANLGSLLKHARQFSGQMEGLQRELKNRRATGSAGGGMVEIDINGANEVLACRIDPQLFARQDRELIEDLIRGAANDAVAKARQLHLEAMKSLTGDLNIPGLDAALAQWSGGPAPGGA